LVVAFAAYALTFPELTGRVVDDAGILDPSTKAALERKLAEFETKTTGQLVVVTLNFREPRLRTTATSSAATGRLDKKRRIPARC